MPKIMAIPTVVAAAAIPPVSGELSLDAEFGGGLDDCVEDVEVEKEAVDEVVEMATVGAEVGRDDVVVDDKDGGSVDMGGVCVGV